MFKSKKQVLWVISAALAFILPAIAFVSPKLRKKPQPATERTQPQSTGNLAKSTSTSKEKVEGEIIAVTPHGFEPAEITRAHKHFVVIVENRTGLVQIELRLDRERGNRLREVSVSRE